MPFRMWFYPLPSLIALLGWLFVLGTRLQLLGTAVGVIVSGIVVYQIFLAKSVVKSNPS